jgi:hypothetical protein
MEPGGRSDCAAPELHAELAAELRSYLVPRRNTERARNSASFVYTPRRGFLLPSKALSASLTGVKPDLLPEPARRAYEET